jgi:hypothetical protein
MLSRRRHCRHPLLSLLAGSALLSALLLVGARSPARASPVAQAPAVAEPADLLRGKRVFLGAGIWSAVAALTFAQQGDDELLVVEERPFDSRWQLLLLTEEDVRLLQRLGVDTGGIERVPWVVEYLFHPVRGKPSPRATVRDTSEDPEAHQGTSIEEAMEFVAASAQDPSDPVEGLRKVEYLAGAFTAVHSRMVPIGVLQRALREALRRAGVTVRAGQRVERDADSGALFVRDLESGQAWPLEDARQVFWGIGGGKRARALVREQFGSWPAPLDAGQPIDNQIALIRYQREPEDRVAQVRRTPLKWAELVSPAYDTVTVLVLLTRQEQALDEAARRERVLERARQLTGRLPSRAREMIFVEETPHVLASYYRDGARHVVGGDAAARQPVLTASGARTGLQAAHVLARRLGEAERGPAAGREQRVAAVLAEYDEFAWLLGMAGATQMARSAPRQPQRPELVTTGGHSFSLRADRIEVPDAHDLLEGVARGIETLLAGEGRGPRAIDAVIGRAFTYLEELRGSPLLPTDRALKDAAAAGGSDRLRRLWRQLRRRVVAAPHDARHYSGLAAYELARSGALAFVGVLALETVDHGLDLLLPVFWPIQLHYALPLLFAALDTVHRTAALAGPDDRLLLRQRRAAPRGRALRRLMPRLGAIARYFAGRQSATVRDQDGGSVLLRRRSWLARIVRQAPLRRRDRQQEGATWSDESGQDDLSQWLYHHSPDGWPATYIARNHLEADAPSGEAGLAPLTAVFSGAIGETERLEHAVSLAQGADLLGRLSSELVGAVDEEVYRSRTGWRWVGEWFRQLVVSWRLQRQAGRVAALGRRAQRLLLQAATRPHLRTPENRALIEGMLADLVAGHRRVAESALRMAELHQKVRFSHDRRERRDHRQQRAAALRALARDVSALWAPYQRRAFARGRGPAQRPAVRSQPRPF